MDRLSSLASAHTNAVSRRCQAHTEWLHEQRELDATTGLKYQKIVRENAIDTKASQVALNVIFG